MMALMKKALSITPQKNLTLALLILILGAISFPFGKVYSSEIDSFHGRYKDIDDSLDILNEKVNELLQRAVKQANLTIYRCNERFFYLNLRRYFWNHILGEFPDWVIKTDKIERIEVPVEESIYRDFDWRAPIVGFYSQRIKDASGAVLRVDGHLVGTDKFEHFFGSGFRYFNTFYRRGGTLEDVLEIGWLAETGLMGAWTTGVMAYGDLVANFQGMRFWNHLLAKNEDVFGSDEKYNPGPYVKCKNFSWKIVGEFDWRNYVDHAWDEGINCSKFRTEDMTNSVLNILDELEAETGKRHHCPVSPEKHREVLKKYAPFAPWLVNPGGHQTVTDERDWAVIL